MTLVPKGTWVEIEQIVLTPEQRASVLPDETRKVPYVLRVSGFLLESGELGKEVSVETIIGRNLSGTLKVVNPSFSHGFGKTIPELLTIGTDKEEH